MSNKSKIIQYSAVDLVVILILVVFSLSRRSDPFWVLEQFSPQLVIIMFAASIVGFFQIIPSLLAILVIFLVYGVFVQDQSVEFMLKLHEFWFLQYAIAFAVCLFSEFNRSIAVNLREKNINEKKWNQLQQKAIQKLESSISALNWKLSVETQPVSQIFKFAKALINAKPEYVARFALDLLRSRFGLQDCAFYSLDEGGFKRLDARGEAIHKWPNSISSINIEAYPYVRAAGERLRAISPIDMPDLKVDPHIAVPIINDTGSLRGLIVCDGVGFMELTEHLVLYISELAQVCASALGEIDTSKFAHARLQKNSVALKHLENADFERTKEEVQRLTKGVNTYVKYTEIAVNGVQNLHGRQTQMLERLIVAQLERQKGILGFFTIADGRISLVHTLESTIGEGLMDDLTTIFAELGILDSISLEIIQS